MSEPVNPARRLSHGPLPGWSAPTGLPGDRDGADAVQALVEAERFADREELLSEAMRIAGVGGWELDPESGALSWSDETFRIFGLVPGSCEPTIALFYSFVEPSDRERMLSEQDAAHQSGTIFDEEYRIIRPDGEMRYLNSRAQVVPRGKDRKNRFLGTVRDITERRLFEQKLAAERARAQQLQAELIHISRVSAMGTMASAMAHEINQPLTSIVNYAAAARLMLEQGDEPKQAIAMLDGVQSSAFRAGTIIRRLREMTMRGQVAHAPVDLAECLDEAVALASTGSAIRINVEVPAGLIVEADRIQLQQVIVNLFRNALEALDERDDGLVAISAKRQDPHAWVAVRDNGGGISEDLLPTIFESFVTTKQGGMGVGLPICRTILDAHGGRLRVDPGPGTGATFHFSIPLAGAKPTD